MHPRLTAFLFGIGYLLKCNLQSATVCKKKKLILGTFPSHFKRLGISSIISDIIKKWSGERKKATKYKKTVTKH